MRMQHVRRRTIASAAAALFALAAPGCHSPTESLPGVVGRGPAIAAYTVPAQGTATSLDIGNWNLEWFGDPNNGPINDALQESNVRDVIAGADLDIWGLEEVVDVT